MKIIFFIILILNLNVLAKSTKDFESETLRLFKENLPIAAAIESKNAVIAKDSVLPGSFSVLTEKVLRESGSVIFNDLNLKQLQRFNNSSFNFLIGSKLYEAKNYKDAEKILKKIKLGHRYYAEKLLFEGASLLEQERIEEAEKTFFSCSVIADDMMNSEDNKKVLNYLTIIKDRCFINLARVKFEQAKFEEAIKSYNQVSKQSFLWPYTLIEKAWAYYHLENYNRSLGLLVTYKSPLLTSYFFPETEFLTTLSYNRLCLWDDALVVIQNYYDKYKTQSEVLKNLLNNNKNKQNFFYDIYVTKDHELEKKYTFVKNIKTHLSKKIRLNLNLLMLERITTEKDLIKNSEGKLKVSKQIEKGYENAIKIAKQNIDQIVKAYLYNYVNEIHKLSYQMFNINLDIVSDKRNLLYVNKSLVSDRARGSFENVDRKINEFFYTFDGPFWADELGDYSFGLKSNCQQVEEKVVSK